MPYCSGICGRFKHKKAKGEKWYINGVKRCNFCRIFMKVNRQNCPCCGTFLRSQGRGTDVKVKRKVARIDANEDD